MKLNKFKAWDIEGNCWIPEAQLAIAAEPHTDGRILTYDEDTDQWLHDGIEVKVVQFINKFDRRGHQIYEGDIVKWKHPYALPGNGKRGEWWYGVVEMQEGVYTYSGVPCNGFMKEGTLEIIGNIFENPEFVEGTES